MIISILASVDSGKTTLSEQILYKTNSITKLGSILDKNTAFDSHQVEKARGITIKSSFSKLHATDIYLIDTPGHNDFNYEVEKSLEIIDLAILVINSLDELNSKTDYLINILKSKKIPFIIFFNKLDYEFNKLDSIIKGLESLNLVDFSSTNNAYEELVYFSSVLEENYNNDCYDIKTLYLEFNKLFSKNEITPFIKGSALKDLGVDSLLELIKNCSYKKATTKDFELFKIEEINNENLISLRTNIDLSIKDEFTYLNLKNEITKAKINTLREYIGTKTSNIKTASKNSLVSINKPQDFLSFDLDYKNNIKSLVVSKIVADNKQALVAALKKLDSEEVSLNFQIKETECYINNFGILHQEYILFELKDRFNVSASIDTTSVVYQETVLKESLGVGHYEPLRHYAEVLLKVRPANEFSFKTSLKSDKLSDIETIKKTILNTHFLGVVSGTKLVNVEVELLDYLIHEEHTSGQDLYYATIRAMYNALMNNSSIILEPFIKVELTTNIEYLSKINNILLKMSASEITYKQDIETVSINFICSLASFNIYSKDFLIITKNKALINTNFYKYDKVLDKLSFTHNPLSDDIHTPHSIFCAKGAGFLVDYKEVFNYMHLKVK